MSNKHTSRCIGPWVASHSGWRCARRFLLAAVLTVVTAGATGCLAYGSHELDAGQGAGRDAARAADVPRDAGMTEHVARDAADHARDQARTSVPLSAPPPVPCDGILGTRGSCAQGYTCGVLIGGAYAFCILDAVHGECPEGLVAGGLGANCLVPCMRDDDCAGWALGVCSPDPYTLEFPGWCAP